MLQQVHLGLALIAVSTAGVFLTLVALFALHAYANNNLHLIARFISYAVEAAMVFADRTATNEILMLIASKEEISEASILGNDGKVLASWHHPKDRPLHSIEQVVDHRALPKPVVLPIIHENKLVGEICLNGHGGSLRHGCHDRLPWCSVPCVRWYCPAGCWSASSDRWMISLV